MEEPDPQSALHSLEARTRHLERGLMFLTGGWLLTVAAVACSAFMRRGQAKTQPASKPADDLRVRRLVVVDDDGVERIVLGAPLPDPQVMGQRRRRRLPAVGLQMNDSDGNERGGVAMLSDGSMMFGIDDEMGQERAHLYYLAGKGPGLIMRDEEGRERVSLPDEASK